MEVPWALEGAVVHNVVVALCTAPLLHSELSWRHRLQCAVEGFLLLDLFSLVAAHKSYKLGVPVGSCFLAKQTVCNLQACCLSAISIVLSREPGFQPFSKGFARLSELSVEQWFGHLRVQSANAQLSSRSYWQAAARQLMKAGKALNGVKPTPLQSEDPLSVTQCLIGFF